MKDVKSKVTRLYREVYWEMYDEVLWGDVFGGALGGALGGVWGDEGGGEKQKLRKIEGMEDVKSKVDGVNWEVYREMFWEVYGVVYDALDWEVYELVKGKNYEKYLRNLPPFHRP